MATKEVSSQVRDTISKVVTMLEKLGDELPGPAKAAMGILRNFVSEEKESFTDEEVAIAMAQFDILKVELDESTELQTFAEEMGKLIAAEQDEREAKHEAQKARARKYGISPLSDALTNLTIPKEYADLGATEEDFADRVNYKYPVWLTKSWENMNEEQRKQVRNAPARFGAFKGNYDEASRAKVEARIEQALKKFKVGEYREPEKAKESIDFSKCNLLESAYLTEAVDGDGLRWEIVCIEAGMSANRKKYSAEVLQAAVPLFENLQSYADHPPRDDKQVIERSVYDLCGWVSEPRWNPTGGRNSQGAVEAVYNALASGPIAAKLKEAWERNKPDLIQFSILGKGNQRVCREDGIGLYHSVESIDALHSLDAVTRGAAGGRVKALAESINQEVKELDTLEKMTVEQLLELRPDLQQVIPPEPKDNSALREIANVQEQMEAIRKDMALAESASVLASKMTGVKDLPTPVVTRIREDFAGKVFDPADLDKAIERERNIWTQVMRDKPRVQTVSIGETQIDKMIHAVDGLLEGQDVEGVPRFHSMHQAYCVVSGRPLDTDRVSVAKSIIREGIGYDPALEADLLRESISWTLVLGATLHRRLIKEYQIPAYDEWKLVVSDITNLTDFKTHRSDRQGYYAVLPSVNKGGTYQPLTSPSEVEASYAATKYGGLEDWTWEDAMNDDLGALKKIPKKLALAAKIGLYQYVMNFLRDGNATVTTYDSINLFDNSHGNLGTAALGTAGLDTAKIAMRSQTALSSTATFIAIRPKYLLVPNELESTAVILRNSDNYVPATIDGVNNVVVANPHKGSFEIIVADYWTDANRWYLVADPKLVPTIEIGFLNGRQEPELLTLAENTGSAFTADKIVMKVRFVYGGAVLDHRGMHASEPS